MGEVAVTVVVTPESPEVDLEELKEQIQELDPRDIEEESVGFGLSNLKVMLVGEGGELDTDDIEAKIREMDGVASVRTEDVTKL